jgi:hypothetical protein
MYNPEKLELPDYEDPRLTKYTWSYEVVLGAVLEPVAVRLSLAHPAKSAMAKDRRCLMWIRS